VSNLNVILTSCLVLTLAIACKHQTVTPISTEKELGKIATRPGVTTISTEKMQPLVTGQVIYVPIYSEIYDFDSHRLVQMTATLSLRNTDLTKPIVIETVDYYNSSGEKISTYLTQPIQLNPLASTEIVVAENDQVGGVGANFIVKWRAAQKVSKPVIEAIMISTISQQGISFVSSGRVIQER
jgi:hypothetical protein